MFRVMRGYEGRGLLAAARALVTGGDSGIGRAVAGWNAFCELDLSRGAALDVTNGSSRAADMHG
jgi:NAD(P)-dependent dehydrogenase (short-subunit alcohol dehydrogenase family)